jgi:hypothetical protein
VWYKQQLSRKVKSKNMKKFTFQLIIVLLLAVLIIPSVALAAWYNPFTWNWNFWSWFKSPAQIQNIQKPTTACVPNWTCGWTPCVNGYQGETAVDLNNCGLPKSGAGIACPALARQCAPLAK